MRSLIVISLCALIACKGKDEAPPAAKPAEPGMVPETTAMPAPGTTASGINLSGLSAQLKKEADNRPRLGVTAEQVFDALDKAGLKTERRKQVLGKAANASYCANARAPEGLVVVVCEYPSADVAASSTKAIAEKFAAISPNVIRKVQGATVLSVVHGGQPSPAIDKILSTFAALKSGS